MGGQIRGVRCEADSAPSSVTTPWANSVIVPTLGGGMRVVSQPSRGQNRLHLTHNELHLIPCRIGVQGGGAEALGRGGRLCVTCTAASPSTNPTCRHEIEAPNNLRRHVSRLMWRGGSQGAPLVDEIELSHDGVRGEPISGG